MPLSLLLGDGIATADDNDASASAANATNGTRRGAANLTLELTDHFSGNVSFSLAAIASEASLGAAADALADDQLDDYRGDGNTSRARLAAEAIADSANMSAATVLVVRLDVRAVAEAPRVTTVGAATGREDEYCVVNVTSATYPDADGSEVGPLQL